MSTPTACSQPVDAGYPTDGVTQPQPGPSAGDPRSQHYVASPSAARPEHVSTPAMARGALAAAAPAPGHLAPRSRKRRRSREPDWDDFYRNGVPEEVIVIGDTPEPEANTSRRITNGYVSAPAGASTATLDHSTARPGPTRKRRRGGDADASRTVDYHVQHVGSHANTSIGSNQSGDGTNSVPGTTVPTSLSSNGQHEDVRVTTPKRRRTRQQAANEAKRRDIDGLGDGGFFTYKPPPFPPKKAGDVRVRVVQEVSL